MHIASVSRAVETRPASSYDNLTGVARSLRAVEAAPAHAAAQGALLTRAGDRTASNARIDTTTTAAATSLSAERAVALAAVSADFQAALTLARDNPAHAGAGWVQVWMPTRGGALPATQAGTASARGKPDGTGTPSITLFSESAFREAYLAEGGPALQALVHAYDSPSLSELLKTHPELLWTALDISGLGQALPPALNGEGPPPAWRPPYSTQALMDAAPAVQLMMQHANAAALAQHQTTLDALPAGTHPSAPDEALHAIDTVLAAPSNQELLTQYSGNAPGLTELDPAAVSSYGARRAQVMALLQRAQGAAGIAAEAPPFRGEEPVSAEWLAQRAALAQQLSAEFEAEVQAAGAATGDKGSLSAEPLVRGDHWRRFLARSSTAAALARHLGLNDPAGLSFAFPASAGGGVLASMANPTWRGGPRPEGMAMGTVEAIGMVDLALADPDNQALIRQFGGPPPVPQGGLALEQVRLYGLTRYQAMTQWSTAMAAVRRHYLVQLNNARSDASNPATAANLPFLKDGKFSVEAFTSWYQAQPGAANQAFSRLMGPLSTRTVPSDEPGQFHGVPEFAQSPWRLIDSTPRPGEAPFLSFQVQDPGTPMDASPTLLAIDPQAPPELRDIQQVGFDVRLGWVTPRHNAHRDPSTTGQWVEGLTMGIIIGGFAWAGGVAAAAGATGTSVSAAAAAMAQGSLSVTGLIAAGASSGATATALGGVMGGGSFRWKDVLKGAFTGAFTAGLAGNLRNIDAIRQYALAHPVSYSALLGGTTQALLGESFKQGVLTGFAQGVAGQVSAQLSAALLDPGLSAEDIARARVFIKALDSAIRIAADPSHPSQAFAAAFLGSIVNDPALHPEPEPAPAPAHAPEAAAGDVLVAGPAELITLTPSSWWARLGESLLQRFLIPFGEALSGPAMAALALFAGPSALGSTERSIPLNDHRRFVLGHGALYGSIEVRDAHGNWVPDGMGANYRMINVQGVLTPMTDAQHNDYLATLRAPTTVPWSPPAAAQGPAPTPGPLAQGGNATGGLAGTPSSPAPTPAVAHASAPGARPPAPQSSVVAPSPALVRPPVDTAPVPAPIPTASPAPMSQVAPIAAPSPLPGYGETPAPPATAIPPWRPPPPSVVGESVIVNPIHIPPPGSPPPSGSTTPVTVPTMIWTPPIGMSVADYILLAERNNWPIPQDMHASRTRPTGTPGGQPQGLPEESGDLGKQRENESAQTLANAGYRVRQGPAQNEQQRMESGLSREMQLQLGLRENARPDYIIEGRVFDCYAPQGDDVRSAVDHMFDKVDRLQTHRLVVNLSDTKLSIDDIKAELASRSDRSRIHEIIFIDDDRIVHVLPNQL